MPIELKMPALSPTMEKGNLAKWLKNVGEAVKAGDLIAEIETDKATMEYEAPEDGILARILFPAGSENIAVGTPIALMAAEGEAVDVGPPLTLVEELDEPEISVSPVALSEAPGVAATPLARRIGAARGISLSQVAASGPHGRIVKRDLDERPAAALDAGASVTARIARQGGLDLSQARAMIGRALQSAAPAPAAVAGFEEVKLSAMRKVIAARLTESKQTIPHFYMTVDVEIDALLALRKEINDSLPEKISVNDIVIMALAKALIKVPEANVQYAAGMLRKFSRADISVAVAIPGGLITPVIRGADRKSLSAISAEMKVLAEKARAGKLLPEEYQGGNFSLSNLGMYGVKQFDAVINPPQAGIMAVGAGEPRAVVRDGKVTVATVMCVTLSVDHRAVDGAVGAELLGAIKGLLEKPLSLLA